MTVVPEVNLDAELIRRYDRSGPRYTSYPPATAFREDFTPADYRAMAAESNRAQPPAPLSLYFHIPFCSTVCYYCACNKIITANRSRAAPYVRALEQELALQGALFGHDRTVEQLHWGGGTPTFLSNDEMHRLMEATRRAFRLRDDGKGEYSIEVDPRTVDAEGVAALAKLGFNRISFGVQDFDATVQKAVNRIQSPEQTLAVMRAARDQGFQSISIDLIYGLPFQSTESFSATLERIIAAEPDRLAVFNYAHLPERFKTQRQIDARTLPSADEKLRILALTIDKLLDAGFVYIGMDHFARPGDALAEALADGSLQRNFQGFSSHAECEIVAMGITGIGRIGRCYAQNVRDLESYHARLETGELPASRGIVLDADDEVRRRVISDLICHGYVDKQAVADAFGLDFDRYFAAEREALAAMQADGLLVDGGQRIRVLGPGRLLIRNICMVFDRYLRADARPQRFSRAI